MFRIIANSRLVRTQFHAVFCSAFATKESFQWLRFPKSKVEGIIEAFQTYKEKYSHCNIPSKFIIPKGDDSWPETLQGVKLGAVFENIQSRQTYKHIHKDLLALGYCITSETKFEALVTAARVYVRQYSSTKIPADFVVPVTEDTNIWPFETRGLRLGHTMRIMKQDVGTESAQNALAELGFTVHANRKKHIWDAVRIYESIYGTINVPKKFVVPSTEGTTIWPEIFHDLPLGHELYKSVKRGVIQIEALENIKTNKDKKDNKWSPRNKQHFAPFYEALQHFKKLKKHLNVTYTYVVPHSNDWPVRFHGMHLGNIVKKVRQKQLFARHREKLTELGFSYKERPKKNLKFIEICQAFEIYKHIHGDLLVPTNYKIQQNDLRYPQNLWGTNLYRIYRSILYEGRHKDLTEKLHEIGFPPIVVPANATNTTTNTVTKTSELLVLNGSGINGKVLKRVKKIKATKTKPLSGRKSFDRLYHALKVYKSVHGTVEVPTTYVVPHGDTRYEPYQWGLVLGKCLREARHGLTYKHEIYRTTLEELGVVYAVPEEDS